MDGANLVAVKASVGSSVLEGAGVGEKTGVTTCGGREVPANSGSGVMDGTGDKSAACKVARRSWGLPVDGMSVMICHRMFSLMDGTYSACASAL